MKTMYVRNTQPGPTVFDEPGSDSQAIIWQGAGDPSGEDMQIVPEEMVESYGFQRCLALGVFVVEESSEEAREMLDKGREMWARKLARQNDPQLREFQGPKEDVVPLEVTSTPQGTRLSGSLSVETGVSTANPEKAEAIKTSMPIRMMPRGQF